MSHLKKLTRKLKTFTGKISKKEPERRRMLFETLEKRILLSADPVMAAQDLEEHKLLIASNITAAEVETLANETVNNESQPDDVKACITPSDAVTAADNSTGIEADTTGDSGSTTTIIPEEDVAATDTNKDTYLKENISVQMSYLLSEDSGRQLVIIDPSVPEYESLINKIFEDNPGGAEKINILQQNTLSEDTDIQNDTVKDDETGISVSVTDQTETDMPVSSSFTVSF
jgi:hypothetical protein